MKLLTLGLIIGSLGSAIAADATPLSVVKKRILAQGELAPFPEAKPVLLELADVIDSHSLKTAISNSRTLQMMRERVRTSLFHLNFKFDIVDENYPYDAPFEEPFPFRPTLEALTEAESFLEIVESATGFKADVKMKIEGFPYFRTLKALFPALKAQGDVAAISREVVAKTPVDSYISFLKRKDLFGEVASFPEFEPAVKGLLTDLQSDEVEGFKVQDPAFANYVDKAIQELSSISQKSGGNGGRLYSQFNAAFPYRQTIQAIERAVLVLDTRERLKYPEGINWHDVEISWYHGNNPKLLALYHFNRYKYQLAGLLAEHEEILLPLWGGVSTEYLIRTRVAPLGLLEIAGTTERLDRHHNSPSDSLYHDGNHNRRMLGYDKRKAKKLGATSRDQRIAIYRAQESFIDGLLGQLELALNLSEEELETRKQARMLIFETLHETALTPDPESMLDDLLRKPATPQPFEVQTQVPISNLEDIRTFDGNLKSGADQLSLNLNQPTTIRYFYDRAPGFLANVDNKLRWGFFDSVFKMQKYITRAKFRTPRRLAIAATRLFEILGHPAPPMEELVSQMTDHSGQQELWNYYGVRERGVLKVSGLNALNLSVPAEIQDNWRMNSLYNERWKPTNARLQDGTIVYDESSRNAYFKEKGIPEYLQEFYRLDVDPISGEVILYEDLRNLPNALLANNHQNENLMSGAKAVGIVDRIWQYRIHFQDLDSVERWLVSACQGVHQAVLDRNANGARNNPIYNQHWLLMPPNNQVNDLDLIRIAFEQRIKVGAESISSEQALLIREGISRLYRKLRTGQPLRTCNAIASHQRDLNLLNKP